MKKIKNPKKILIIKFGAIGDIVHTSVVATAVKAAYPSCEVHYLTTKGYKAFLELQPDVDKIQLWDVVSAKSKKYLFQRTQELAKEGYDLVFNMTRSLKTILISYLIAPFNVVNKRNFKNVSWVEGHFLNAKRYLPSIFLPERLFWGVDKNLINKLEQEFAQYPRPYIMLFPSGEADNNRQGRTWGVDNWNTLVKELAPFGGTIFVSGTVSERANHERITGAQILSGKHSLVESCHLMSMADLVISGDSGPAHIAAAYGVKTLALLGSTSIDKIKPFGYNGWAVSSPNQCNSCWKKKCKFFSKGQTGVTPCMNAITPALVVEKIKEYKLL